MYRFDLTEKQQIANLLGESLTQECVEALDDRPLRQGDVFLWGESHKQRPWQELGIIVTADCDLAHDKTFGRLSYVPVISDADYWWRFWRPSRFEKIKSRALETATARVDAQLRKANPAHLTISGEALIDWLARCGSHGVATECGLVDRGQINDLVRALDPVINLERLLATEEPDWPLLRSLMPLRRKNADTNNYEALRRDIKDDLASLPGDVFFLSSIPGSAETGYFVMLRYISQCEINDVATNAAEFRYGKSKARRVARVSSPYLYAMTQGIARIFSDIGLPGSYQSRRESGPSDMIARIETIK